MRFRDESAAIREAFPAEYVDLAVIVTEFGGPALLMVLLSLLYWLTRRRETALVVSYAVAGVGFILVLKVLLAMPRPPEEVYLVSHDADPYGFPSGHAFAATVVYGGLVVAFDRLRDPPAVAAAIVAIVLVSLSRVVLGVHYLGDVVAGAIVGVGFLLAAGRIVDGDPARGFAIGFALAIPAVVLSGAESESLIALGGSVGGYLASLRLESIPDLRSRIEGAVLSVVGLGIVVAGVAIESMVGAAASATVAALGVAVVNAALFAGIMLVPAAVGRLEIEAIESGTTG